jgi:hypothetical protein
MCGFKYTKNLPSKNKGGELNQSSWNETNIKKTPHLEKQGVTLILGY